MAQGSAIHQEELRPSLKYPVTPEHVVLPVDGVVVMGARDRRRFLRDASRIAGGFYIAGLGSRPAGAKEGSTVMKLPEGDAPQPVSSPHFPDRLHAYVWRNWGLVPLARMAQVVDANAEQIRRAGESMGLSGPPRIPRGQQDRSYITIIRRNWHLLPYDQLLRLLDWNAEQLEYTLREDDFLYVKLGNHKPRCEPVRYQSPDEQTQTRARHLGEVFRKEMEGESGAHPEPLFQFVTDLSRPVQGNAPPAPSGGLFQPRFCYSYFALYGDPLLNGEADSYPDGYLQRLAASGVDGIWLQGVLQKLAPFPWEPSRSDRHEERLQNLKRLVARAREHGIGVYLYLNEPRALLHAFFEQRPGLKGVTEGEYAALCTSAPEVQEYLTQAVETVCRAVPELSGIFTITASENLTNCWSHYRGAECPRCGKRTPAEVIAEVNGLLERGIRRAGAKTRLMAWDWGWQDAWAPDTIRALSTEATLMSVSEWSLPLHRGGVATEVGEYSISAIGPGPRATRHWNLARERGLRTIAKIQAGNTWELSAVPYIPALENVARHMENLRGAGIQGLMLGWTLGGYPSPNLEVAAVMGSDPHLSPEAALQRVAERRFGAKAAQAVVQAWRTCSMAFREFPYHGSVVYSAPLQMGPANPLWEKPTHHRASMVGLPYDDLTSWRGPYPADIFVGQMERVATGFEAALAELRGAPAPSEAGERHELDRERSVMEAAALHFRSVANQARFVQARDQLAAANASARAALCDTLEHLLRCELDLARRLHAVQSQDSRIGFEASNQYFYVPADLAEKILNCRDLLDRWLPAQRAVD